MHLCVEDLKKYAPKRFLNEFSALPVVFRHVVSRPVVGRPTGVELDGDSRNNTRSRFVIVGRTP